MTPKSTKNTKPTGINKVIEKGAPEQEMQGRVICKNCGKDINFTKTVRLHLNCPRCNAALERNIDQEYKQAKRVINYDFYLRNKKYFLYLGLVLASMALAFNTIGFFTQLFVNGRFWIALLSLPFVLINIAIIHFPRLKSQSRKHKILAWLLLVLNILAILAIIATAIPQLNDAIYRWYSV